MALTNAERQKRHYEKRKALLKAASDLTRKHQAEPFFEWMNDAKWSEVEFPLGLAGLKLKRFTDDSGAKTITAEFDESGTAEGYYDQYDGSIGRAELAVSSLLEAATELARHVNTYKLEQIDREIAEREKADLSAPKTREATRAEINRLNKIRDRLHKRVRWELAEWKVKEV